MGNTGNCQRIVRTYAGPRTGEQVYVTADGRRWTSELWPHPTGGTATTGVTTGYVHHGYMCQEHDRLTPSPPRPRRARTATVRPFGSVEPA